MMEEKNQPVIHIDIHGGNNQILPVATKAEQHFYFAEGPSRPAGHVAEAPEWTPEDEERLSLYIHHKEDLPAYIATLAACTTAAEVGEAVVRMCGNEPVITAELIVKEKFIRLLVPFLVKVDKGKGIDNLRVNINAAWAANRKHRPKPAP